MQIFRKIFLPIIIACCVTVASAQKTVADFRLKNTANKWVSLKNYPFAKGFVVVFICNHCPFVSRYTERLNSLHKKYSALGVPLLAINSTDELIFREETFLKMVQTAKNRQYNFPYLRDNTQSAGKNFGANKTPHAFVVWKENNNLTIKYNGSLDDNGGEPSKVRHAYIDDALDSLLAGKPVATPTTNSIGCEIQYRPNPKVFL